MVNTISPETIKSISIIINVEFKKIDYVWGKVGYTLEKNKIDFGFFNLKIDDAKFTKLIDEILEIENIRFIDFGYNEISNLEYLSRLSSLDSLRIENNNIKDISVLQKFTSLDQLYAGNNQITDLSPLRNLSKLDYIDLEGNKISNIEPLKNCFYIKNLVLLHNPIKEINSWVLNADKVTFGGYYDYADSNKWYLPETIEYPPIEILKKGKESALRWFESKKKKLNEIKVILIGEPKAGKTSLLKRLKFGTFNKDEAQTDGVNIEDIEFGKCKAFKKQKSLHSLTAHFWDFGGQEIMNATHQFFLTKRSVYVLVLDARKDANSSSQIREWVKRVKATGGDSPIIVLANQIDVNPGFGFENERELQDEFPQIKCFIKVSCSTNENIDLFKTKLEEIIPTAELFKTEIDEKWITIKERLQEETKATYFLDETRFLAICDEANLKEKQGQKDSINFLHDLGLILHFEDLNLSEYYVLDPYWITYGVYQILTSVYAGNMKGKVGMDKLEYIVNEEKDKKEIYNPANYKKIKYAPNQRRFLVDILHQFKLCFCAADHSYFIIPDLLDTKEPLDITEPIRVSGENIQFVYDYEYLPKSIMPNIMVETHKIIKEMWRTGCVLQNNGCKALITNYQNRISITVTGEHKKKREFMSVIRFLLDSINQKLSNKPVALIPLPGVNAFVSYERLLAREKSGKTHYVFDEDMPTEKSFLISELLEGIPTNEEVRDFGAKFKDEVLTRLDGLKHNTELIINKLNLHYEYLINLPNNSKIKEGIQEAIKEMNAQQTVEITDEIMNWINTAFVAFDGEMDDKLKEIYNDLKKTDDLQIKLKLAVPFINMLGPNLSAEFDVKSWAKKMYKKHELKIFKLMGLV